MQLFIKYDEDLDHLLTKEEFSNFLNFVIPYLTNKEKDYIFEYTNISKSDKINFEEFKKAFNQICLIGRIKDIFREISNLKVVE